MTFGAEATTPEESHPDAGRNVYRRYAHVWRQDGSDWRILLRSVSLDRVD